ncbi:MAG: efflux RND transporter periplasmic adaptor subunit [Proteiniphilum sp.]|jgi:RND family efflux transporter MFP subunit|nr:efflux RND transporter periplasmic adaptor subunit [Proteiniphilum sp.]
MNEKSVFAAMMLCVLTACSGEKTTERQVTAVPVKVIEIAATQRTGVRNYVGTVEESAAVSLSFARSGTVEEVFVQEGQRVTKGLLLATLATATAENTYQGAVAKLRQAQDAYDRLAKVHENGSLPDIRLVEVETGLQQAKSMAAVAGKSLEDCRLYAPRGGVISGRDIEPGMNVMPGIQALKLISVETVLVRIPVPESEIGKIAVGQTAAVSVAALDGAAFTGRVIMKGVSASPVSHTYGAKIEIANSAGADNHSPLLPGMVCRVSLAEDAKAAEVVVPNRTVQIAADGRKYVWIADGNVARRQFVETGGLDDNGIVVTGGLSAGDRLITEGFLKISEGTAIVISE